MALVFEIMRVREAGEEALSVLKAKINSDDLNFVEKPPAEPLTEYPNGGTEPLVNSDRESNENDEDRSDGDEY